MDEEDAFVELIRLAMKAEKTQAEYLLWKCLSKSRSGNEEGRHPSRLVIPDSLRYRLRSL